MKVLLGGIPLGCNNIGDEAIIACVVKILKSSVPGIELTVATQDKNTSSLGVETVPAFGFDGVEIGGFRKTIKSFDAFIWCGATGLSDYPHIPLKLLEIAQNAGKATFVWGVGMDDELNPVFFKVRGKRRFLLKIFGLVGAYEKWIKKRLARKIARILPKCRGVWLRDEESCRMLESMGYKDAKLAADSAILLRPSEAGLPETQKNSKPTLGLCISTQRRVADIEGVRRMIANVRKAGWDVLGLPMNPKTDRKLLESLSVNCIPGDKPEDIVDAVRKCAVVLSSRLHLLILAANSSVPILGIARGSKLANWLKNFGRDVSGSVYDADWDAITNEILASGEKNKEWKKIRDEAYARLDMRLSAAREELAEKLKELG